MSLSQALNQFAQNLGRYQAVERYWLFCFVVALSSATDVRPQCSAALREPVPM